MPPANAETMSLHLTVIGRKVAAGSHAALVLDGAGYHIAAALTIPENVTLVRLPPYAPELNPIENVWESRREEYSAAPTVPLNTTSIPPGKFLATCTSVSLSANFWDWVM